MLQFIAPADFHKVEDQQLNEVLSNSHARNGFKFFDGDVVKFGTQVYTHERQEKDSNGNPRISCFIEAEIHGKPLLLSFACLSSFPRDVDSMAVKYPFMAQLINGSDFERYDLIKGKSFKVSLIEGEGIDWTKYKPGDKGDALVWKTKKFPMFTPID